MKKMSGRFLNVIFTFIALNFEQQSTETERNQPKICTNQNIDTND